MSRKMSPRQKLRRTQRCCVPSGQNRTPAGRQATQPSHDAPCLGFGLLASAWSAAPKTGGKNCCPNTMAPHHDTISQWKAGSSSTAFLTVSHGKIRRGPPPHLLGAGTLGDLTAAISDPAMLCGGGPFAEQCPDTIVGSRPTETIAMVRQINTPSVVRIVVWALLAAVAVAVAVGFGVRLGRSSSCACSLVSCTGPQNDRVVPGSVP